MIRKGEVISEGILNRVEMAFRSYDPCFGCATHSLPGEMPLVVSIYNSRRELVDQIRRNT
jgi:F420-non-reducing hydrogenase large subunit